MEQAVCTGGSIMYNMGLKGATTVLKKECVFLGMSMGELLHHIKLYPMSMPNKTLLAYKIYKAQGGIL